MDRVDCPFCGEWFEPITHPLSNECPMSGYGFATMKWQMRPPKKFAPQGKTIVSEVEFLRGMVAEAILQLAGRVRDENRGM